MQVLGWQKFLYKADCFSMTFQFLVSSVDQVRLLALATLTGPTRANNNLYQPRAVSLCARVHFFQSTIKQSLKF